MDFSLTDRGLLDLDIVFVAAATLSFAAGLAWGRLWALLAPVGLTALVYLGVERSWWGGGFVDGWEGMFAFHTVVGIIIAGGGVVIRPADRHGFLSTMASDALDRLGEPVEAGAQALAPMQQVRRAFTLAPKH